MALGEHGTTQIDPYKDNTIDKGLTLDQAVSLLAPGTDERCCGQAAVHLAGGVA